jgi:hypothetical protein
MRPSKLVWMMWVGALVGASGCAAKAGKLQSTKDARDGRYTPSEEHRRVLVDRYGHQHPTEGLDELWEPRAGDHLPVEVDLGDYFALDKRWAVDTVPRAETTLLNLLDAGGALKLPGGMGRVFVWAPEGPAALETWVAGGAGAAVNTVTRHEASVPVANLGAAFTVGVDCSGAITSVAVNGLTNGAVIPAPPGHVLVGVEDTLYIGVDAVGCPGVPTVTITQGGVSVAVQVSAVSTSQVATATALSCERHAVLTDVVRSRFPAITGPGDVYACPVADDVVGLRVLSTLDAAAHKYRVWKEITSIIRGPAVVGVAVTGSAGEVQTTTRSGAADALVGRVPLLLSLLQGDMHLGVELAEADGASSKTTRSDVGVLGVAAEPLSPPIVDIHVGMLVRDSLRTTMLTGMISPIYNPKSVLDWPRNFKHSGFVHAPVPVAGIRLGADEDVLGLVMGVGMSVVPGWKIVSGLEFGTGDITRPWRADRSWFVGITLSPNLFDKLVKTARSRAKSSP